jgi:hypothetical protein
MNDRKIKQLFAAAHKDTAPAPAEGFELLVMQQIRCNPTRHELTISDLLGRWFPRLALASVTIIALCFVGELVFSSGAPSLTESAAQLSDQFYVEN